VYKFGSILSRLLILMIAANCGFTFAASNKERDPLAFETKFQLELLPLQSIGRVTISVDSGELLESLSFSNKDGIYSNIKANGKLTIKDQLVLWELPKGPAQLTYTMKIAHERTPGKFDAMMTNDWALFRGDDVIPAMHIYEVDGAYSQSTLEILMPEGWSSVETGWPRKKGNIFTIDNPDRRFDRPTGWIMAGKIGTRRASVANTSIAVTAPKGENFQRMDALTFLNFVWPQVQEAFKHTPKKLLIVGAGDPMWRGGLSASNSLFLHSDRPLVSENGTSPLLHELTHMVTRISGLVAANKNDDWIAEGLAEFYSFELLYRANGMTKSRRNTVIRSLSNWGKDVKHLRATKSTGPVTARAVVLLDELDREIRKRSYDKYSLDNVVRELMIKRKVSLDDLRKISEKLVGAKLKVFSSPLLL
jgi:predicted metalloprotease with PDZ domain